MQVAVAGHGASKQIAVRKALAAAGRHVEQGRLDVGLRDARLMELLAPERRVRRTQGRHGARAHLEVADCKMARIHRDVDWQHTAHRVTGAVEAGQRASEIEQPSTLRVQRHAIGDALAQLSGKRDVGGKLRREALGVATADVHRIDVRWQLGIERRPKSHQLESCVLEKQQVLLVVERERPVACDRQPRERRAVVGNGLGAPVRPPATGDPHEALDVQVIGRASMCVMPLRAGSLILLDGHEAEMALRDRQRGTTRNGADHEREQVLGHGIHDHLRVRLTPNAVEHTAGYAQVRIKGPEPFEDRGGGARHAPHVENDDDRHVEELCHLGGAATLGSVLPVVERTHRLDH